MGNIVLYRVTPRVKAKLGKEKFQDISEGNEIIYFVTFKYELHNLKNSIKKILMNSEN